MVRDPARSAADASSSAPDRLPPPQFGHLRRMTGRMGLWEHARYTTPRIEHGCCTDDNARGLVVISRETEPSPELLEIAAIYLAFVREAGSAHDGFHNRRNAEGAWTDVQGSDDSQGRALWGLGSVAHSALPTEMRDTALELFVEKLDFHSPSPRANAFVVLGAAEVLETSPGHPRALSALERSVAVIQPRSDTRWPWPEDRTAYDNARLPEALLAAGASLDNTGLVDSGLRLLEWLVAAETSGDHFSFTPTRGWALGEVRPGFDQQPVEAAAMADACHRAWELTGDPDWKERVLATSRWFLGANDSGAILYDTRTGGGLDGLTADGANQNQGAESTLAALSTLQRAAMVR